MCDVSAAPRRPPAAVAALRSAAPSEQTAGDPAPDRARGACSHLHVLQWPARVRVRSDPSLHACICIERRPPGPYGLRGVEVASQIGGWLDLTACAAAAEYTGGILLV